MHTGETLHLVLMILLTPISFGAMGIVVWWYLTQRNDGTEAGNVDQIWNKRDQWGEEICRQLINRQIVAGMSSEMVELAWGSPTNIETRTGGDEAWLYQVPGGGQSAGSVLLRNNIVIQSTGSPAKTGKSSAPWIIITATLVLAVIVSIITLLVIALVG